MALTPAQAAQFKSLATKTLAALEAEFADAQTKYLRKVAFSPGTGEWYALTGIDQSVLLGFNQTQTALDTLKQMLPQVPVGGPPHGDSAKWVAAWIDLADSTEETLRQNVLFVARNSYFNALMDSLLAYGKTVGAAVGGAASIASGLTVVAGLFAAYLLLKEARVARKEAKA